ncbi:MAG: hypothetical protein MAGBODY4_00699 [Candidatus Marinimicrobia bacterium]|nr:hypothetical protein [Candidatus Neomarinimicrobiota bacterium]
MPILQNTGCIDRHKIVDEFYPFASPENFTGMIIGNDLDSVLSAAVLHHRFGWDITGIYDYEILWYPGRFADFRHQLFNGELMAIDLDIYHEEVSSLGHHIIGDKEKADLPGHAQMLNPNEIRGISTENFHRKYPLGTIHFLLWLFNEEITDELSRALIWLADSAFINGQSHKYRENVAEWIKNYLKSRWLQASLEIIDTPDFEKLVVEKLFPLLESTGFSQGDGQIVSRHRKLSGFQCQYGNPNQARNRLLRLFRFVYQLTGWTSPNIPRVFGAHRGLRQRMDGKELYEKYGSLHNFLEKEPVFSYVFPFRNQINYTIMKLNRNRL